jgi:tetratricopeptide (TPR) repeat protein
MLASLARFSATDLTRIVRSAPGSPRAEYLRAREIAAAAGCGPKVAESHVLISGQIAYPRCVPKKPEAELTEVLRDEDLEDAGRPTSPRNSAQALPPPPPPPAARGPAKRASQAGAAPRASLPDPPPRPSATRPVEAPPAPRRTQEPGELGEAALIERMRAELARDPEPGRAARLHYELGMLLERGESKPARAAEHYRKAAELRSDHRPSVQGARRTLSCLGRHADALPLFDAEQRLCASPEERARLALEKGGVLEHKLGRADDALAAYREGLALDRRNVELLRAAARIERRAERWDALDRTLEQLASCIEGDAAFRAAVIAERARIADVRKREPARALELYLAALALDPDVGGAAEAIKRLAHALGQFQQLAAVFEQEAARSPDPDVRRAAHARSAELLESRLGELDRAIAAQQAAAGELPEDRAALERLCELYARKGDARGQIAVLQRLRALAVGAPGGAALSVRMAELAERALEDPKLAETHYLAALELDPAHRPALAALGALYARSSDQRGLLAVHARELELAVEGFAKAELLVRMGALLEGGAGDREQAAEHYARALAACADHDGALRGLDRLLPALGRHRELAQAYEQVIDRLENVDQKIAYLFRIGALYEDRLDEPGAAVAAYERVLRVAPDHRAALHALQRAAATADEHEKARHALQREAKLLAPAPRAADLLYRAAELLADRLGNPSAAIAALEQVLAEHPRHAPAMARLRALYRSEQRWDGLLALLVRSLQASLEPAARAELAFEIGQLCELTLGRATDAIAYYGRALDAQPDHRPAFAALTAALRASAKWSELASVFEARAKASGDARERARLLCELGVLYEDRLGDGVRALQAFGRALEAQPNLRPALDARARLLCARADLPRLARALHDEAAHGEDPQLALAALERAAVVEAELLGDAKAALASYRELLERAPGRISALLALETLGLATRDKKALAAAYAAQAATAADTNIKVAALRDLAHAASTPEEAAHAYRALVALRSDDVEALSALVEQARATRDVAAELAHCARLAQGAEDRGLSAMHHLAIAAQIEARDPAQALANYRKALALDPHSLTAVRGLTRAALAFALPQALSEAAGHEARVTRDVELCVTLLLRAADLRERSADFKGAAVDAQRALEYDPEHVLAAQVLSSVLGQAGEQPRLAELLARAAEAAADERRRADLYTQAAQIRSQLGDAAAAVSCAERALAARPDHAPALALLARCHESSGRWEQALAAYERRAETTRDPAERAAAQLSVASIAGERLRDPARAHKHLRLLLAVEPENRSALALQAKLLLGAGKHEGALETLRKLAQTAQDDAERARSLLDLADAERRAGNAEGAEQALYEAIVLQGPGGDAERAYLASAQPSTERYVEALARHLSAQRERDVPAAGTVRAIARAQAERLGDRTSALETLREGTQRFSDDAGLWLDYAALLVDAGKHDQALAHLRQRIALAADRPELWQALAAAHRGAGRAAEAISSGLPLLWLDAASGEQRVLMQSRKPRPADNAAPLDDALVRELDPEGVLTSPCAVLARTLAPALAKLRTVDLGARNVSRRDRVPEDSDHKLRLVVDRLLRMLEAPECELYLTDSSEPRVELILGEPSILLVPRAVAALSKSRLVFALAPPLFCLRHELGAVAALPTRELPILLAGAVRRQRPDYARGLADETELDEASRAISKAVPWLSRKRVDEAAAELAQAGAESLEPWCERVRTLAARAALLLCDDLPGAFELLAAERGRSTADPLVRDLLALWASDLAVRYRQRLT